MVFYKHWPKAFFSSRQHPFLSRLTVLSVLLTFVFPYLAWSFVPPVLRPNQIEFENRVIRVPGQYGTVARTIPGTRGLVIHIQDLHCNYEVQSNIAKLLDYLSGRLGIRLVGVEGASLPLDVRKLSTFPDERAKQEVGDYFVRQGRMSGAEYYAAVGRHPIRLVGVEDAAHYRAGREGVAKFVTSESQGYISDLRDLLGQLKPRLYSRALAAFDRERVKFQNREQSILHYARFLADQARQTGLTSLNAPHVESYLAHAESGAPGLEADALYQELDALDGRLRLRLYTRPGQAELDQFEQRLDIMQKMLNISATPAEVARYRLHPGQFRITAFADFIRQFNPDQMLDPGLFDLDALLQEASDFYDNADLRSRDLVRNLEARMAEQQVRSAVLVTGGYHTGQIMAQLKAQGLACVSIKPRLQHQDLINPYFSLLRHQVTPLQRLLAQDQKIISLEPFFMPWPDPEATLAEPDLSREVRGGYRALEALLKLDVLHHLAGLGMPLAALRQHYKKILAPYDTTVMPDFSQARLQNGEMLVPFGKRFFARITSRTPGQDLLQGSLQTATVGGFHLIFYSYDLWEQQASVFDRAAHGKRAQAQLRRHLGQALVLGGTLAWNPAHLLVQEEQALSNRLRAFAVRIKSVLLNDQGRMRPLVTAAAGMLLLALGAKLAATAFSIKLAAVAVAGWTTTSTPRYIFKSSNAVSSKIVSAQAIPYDGTQALPQIPQDEDFILVVQHPNSKDLARLVKNFRYRLKGIIVNGLYPSGYAAELCEEYDIPVLADPEHSGYPLIRQGNVLLINADEKSVLVHPAEKNYLHQQLAADALRETFSAKAEPAAGMEFSATLAAIPTLPEAALINAHAQGNGLLITEGFYLQRRAPTEEQLVRAFKQLSNRLHGTATLCALERRPGAQDVFPSESPHGIDFLLGPGRDVFRTQCRAFLLAFATAQHKNLRLVVPGIQNSRQAGEAYRILELAREALVASGRISKKALEGFQFGVAIDPNAMEKNQSVDDILEAAHAGFLLIGRRDQGRLDQNYLNAVHLMVQAAQARHVPFSFRGEDAANRALILALAAWDVTPLRLILPLPQMAPVKVFITNIDKARLDSGTTLDKFESEAKAVQETIVRRMEADPFYQKSLERLYLQHGLRQTLHLYLKNFPELASIVSYVHFLSVMAIDSAENQALTVDDLEDKDSIFPLMTIMGLATALSLGYRGNNGNPVLLGWYRSLLSLLIRTMLENDAAGHYHVVAASGSRKSWARPLEGANFGQGNEHTDVVLLGPEMEQALVNPNKKGTLLAMAFGPQGSFLPLPDTSFMFKIVVSRGLAGINVEKILGDCRKGEAVDEDKLVRTLLDACHAQGVEKPQIEILFRPRHRVLIQKFREAMQINLPRKGLKKTIAESDGQCLLSGEKGSLLIREDDDCLHGGLSLGKKPGGPDLIVGAGGAAQTLGSAILARLAGGKVAAIFFPLKGRRFTPQEKKALEKFNLDSKMIFTESTLVPGQPDKIAVAAGVLGDYALAGKQVPGPRMLPEKEFKGSVEEHFFLLLSHGRFQDMTLRCVTDLTHLLRNLPSTQTAPARRVSVRQAIEVALACTHFGELKEAQDWLTKIPGRITPQEQAEVDAVELYVAGRLLMAGEKMGWILNNVLAARRFEQAQTIIQRHGLDQLNAWLRLPQKISELYRGMQYEAEYLARQTGEDTRKQKLWKLAQRFSQLALNHAQTGFEQELQSSRASNVQSQPKETKTPAKLKILKSLMQSDGRMAITARPVDAKGFYAEPSIKMTVSTRALTEQEQKLVQQTLAGIQKLAEGKTNGEGQDQQALESLLKQVREYRDGSGRILAIQNLDGLPANIALTGLSLPVVHHILLPVELLQKGTDPLVLRAALEEELLQPSDYAYIPVVHDAQGLPARIDEDAAKRIAQWRQKHVRDTEGGLHAIGKFTDIQCVPVDANHVLVTGKTPEGGEVNLRVTLARPDKKQRRQIGASLQHWRALKPGPGWIESDPKDLQNHIRKLETLQAMTTEESPNVMKGFHGIYIIQNFDVIQGPKDTVFQGLPLGRDGLLVQADKDQVVFAPRLMHEIGGTLGYAHRFSRGEGDKKRKELQQQQKPLTAEERGFQERMLGSEAQERLTGEIQAAKKRARARHVDTPAGTPADLAALETNNRAFNTPASRPGLPWLRSLRFLRIPGMALLFALFRMSGFFIRADQHDSPSQAQARAYLQNAIGVYAPLNGLEAQHGGSQLQGRLLRQGSLLQGMLGGYHAGILSVEEPLVVAAGRTLLQETGWRARLAGFQTEVARHLIGQIIYYRSAEHDRQNIGRRWAALWAQVRLQRQALPTRNFPKASTGLAGTALYGAIWAVTTLYRTYQQRWPRQPEKPEQQKVPPRPRPYLHSFSNAA